MKRFLLLVLVIGMIFLENCDVDLPDWLDGPLIVDYEININPNHPFTGKLVFKVNGNLHTVDLREGIVHQITEDGASDVWAYQYPRWFGVAPSVIAVHQMNSIISIDKNDIEHLVCTISGSWLEQIDGARDGSIIAYVMGNKVYFYDLASKTSIEIATGNHPKIYPDGQHIAFSENMFYNGENLGGLLLYDLEPNDMEPLTHSRDKRVSGPHYWSPDGRYIAVPQESTVNFEKELTILDVTTCVTRALAATEIGPICGWSADGNYIFTLNYAERSLEAVHFQTGQKITVLSGIALTWDNAAVFSP